MKENGALDGTASTSWVRAADNALYPWLMSIGGARQILARPGIEKAVILPVTLSHFRANRTESGVVLEWATQSEVDNAGSISCGVKRSPVALQR